MASVKLNEMVQAKHDSTALGTGRTALSGSHVSACCEPDCLVTAFETTVYIGEAILAVVAVNHVRLTIIGPDSPGKLHRLYSTRPRVHRGHSVAIGSLD